MWLLLKTTNALKQDFYPQGGGPSMMALHPFGSPRFPRSSSETMSDQIYHLISIYEYALFVSHQYTHTKSFIPNNVDMNSGSWLLPDTKHFGQPDGSLSLRLEKNWWAFTSMSLFAGASADDFEVDFTVKKDSGWEEQNKASLRPDIGSSGRSTVLITSHPPPVEVKSSCLALKTFITGPFCFLHRLVVYGLNSPILCPSKIALEEIVHLLHSASIYGVLTVLGAVL